MCVTGSTGALLRWTRWTPAGLGGRPLDSVDARWTLLDSWWTLLDSWWTLLDSWRTLLDSWRTLLDSWWTPVSSGWSRRGGYCRLIGPITLHSRHQSAGGAISLVQRARSHATMEKIVVDYG